jgi:hypothetical protein
MTRTAGGKVLGISATAPVTIAGEAVRCPRDPAATARRDSAPFQQSGTVIAHTPGSVCVVDTDY